MNIELKANERIDDLEYNDLRIIQNKNGFCFGIDSILLTDFAKNIKSGSTVLDLGTGTGIIPILLSAKTNAKSFVGIEIQDEVAKMAGRSVRLNSLDNKIKIINDNIKNYKNLFSRSSFDVVITNPPYKKAKTGLVSENNMQLISRHEISATLEDFIEISSYLLKDFGEFYMIHRPERLVDIFSIMRDKKIEPKRIRFICPNSNKKANMVLIKGVKLGKQFLVVDEDLIIYKEDGKYTDEVLKIYSKWE